MCFKLLGVAVFVCNTLENNFAHELIFFDHKTTIQGDQKPYSVLY